MEGHGLLHVAVVSCFLWCTNAVRLLDDAPPAASFPGPLEQGNGSSLLAVQKDHDAQAPTKTLGSVLYDIDYETEAPTLIARSTLEIIDAVQRYRASTMVFKVSADTPAVQFGIMKYHFTGGLDISMEWTGPALTIVEGKPQARKLTVGINGGAVLNLPFADAELSVQCSGSLELFSPNSKSFKDLAITGLGSFLRASLRKIEGNLLGSLQSTGGNAQVDLKTALSSLPTDYGHGEHSEQYYWAIYAINQATKIRTAMSSLKAWLKGAGPASKWTSHDLDRQVAKGGVTGVLNFALSTVAEQTGQRSGTEEVVHIAEILSRHIAKSLFFSSEDYPEAGLGTDCSAVGHKAEIPMHLCPDTMDLSCYSFRSDGQPLPVEDGGVIHGAAGELIVVPKLKIVLPAKRFCLLLNSIAGLSSTYRAIAKSPWQGSSSTFKLPGYIYQVMPEVWVGLHETYEKFARSGAPAAAARDDLDKVFQFVVEEWISDEDYRWLRTTWRRNPKMQTSISIRSSVLETSPEADEASEKQEEERQWKFLKQANADREGACDHIASPAETQRACQAIFSRETLETLSSPRKFKELREQFPSAAQLMELDHITCACGSIVSSVLRKNPGAALADLIGEAGDDPENDDASLNLQVEFTGEIGLSIKGAVMGNKAGVDVSISKGLSAEGVIASDGVAEWSKIEAEAFNVNAGMKWTDAASTAKVKYQFAGNPAPLFWKYTGSNEHRVSFRLPPPSEDFWEKIRSGAKGLMQTVKPIADALQSAAGAINLERLNTMEGQGNSLQEHMTPDALADHFSRFQNVITTGFGSVSAATGETSGAITGFMKDLNSMATTSNQAQLDVYVKYQYEDGYMVTAGDGQQHAIYAFGLTVKNKVALDFLSKFDSLKDIFGDLKVKFQWHTTIDLSGLMKAGLIDDKAIEAASAVTQM
eukprot:TRINITY_DN29892_c0_g2_i1.p1 TRINITY_DN29892_c0_g2~~TRINITY_DN29892_c0_g2_i1.p1  ORF type:complete len:929 (+),score=173.89 TRINITY_DN29892_c0_g2_i1:81-2867(+)